MPSSTRRLALVVHVCASVGWLGAVVAFAALAVTGLASDERDLVRGAYLSMEVLGTFVLVPLALLSLLSGIVMSLGTVWGLFRHYWVVFKLGINLLATAILLAYTQTLASLGDVARGATSGAEFAALETPSPLVHAVAALALLLVALTLAVYKPRGLTPLATRRSGRREIPARD